MKNADLEPNHKINNNKIIIEKKVVITYCTVDVIWRVEFLVKSSDNLSFFLCAKMLIGKILFSK